MAEMHQLNKDEIKNNVKQFIIDNFLFSSIDNSFHDDDSFMENGIIDSTGILELVEYIEHQYNIKIKDEELLPENLDTLNNVSNFIIRKMNML